MRSPCHGCARELEDKNEIECMRCALRLEYVGILGPMTENVPIEQTNLVEGVMRGRQVSPEEKEFIKANLGKMKTVDMAKHLKRNINTVYNTINIIRKEDRLAGRVKVEVEEKEGGNERQAPLPLGGRPPIPPEEKISQILGVRTGVFEKLKELAEAHFRTVEQELCWLVAQSHKRMTGEPK